MRITLVIASLFAAAGATSAAAQQVEQRIATIALSDADLADGHRTRALASRIEAAIGNVCGSGPATLQQFTEIARCRVAARADIDRQIAKRLHSTLMAARKR